MEAYKTEFIDFMVSAGVLTFGDFVTKSGRQTPYFINTGRYRTGSQLIRLAHFYAEAIRAQGVEFDVLFGPAYKGIPLATAVSMALSESTRDVAFCFNRKEAKDHGEGGSLVGHPLVDGDRVLLVEDVTTAGTSIHETVPLLRAAADITLSGLVVSVDRQERGRSECSALAELESTYNMPCFAIVTLDEIVEHLRGRVVGEAVLLTEERLSALQRYRERYGA